MLRIRLVAQILRAAHRKSYISFGISAGHQSHFQFFFNIFTSASFAEPRSLQADNTGSVEHNVFMHMFQELDTYPLSAAQRRSYFVGHALIFCDTSSMTTFASPFGGTRQKQWTSRSNANSLLQNPCCRTMWYPTHAVEQCAIQPISL